MNLDWGANTNVLLCCHAAMQSSESIWFMALHVDDW
jgi:hypothetical protein